MTHEEVKMGGISPAHQIAPTIGGGKGTGTRGGVGDKVAPTVGSR